MMYVILTIIILLSIMYAYGIIKIYEAMNEIDRLQNEWMCKHINMMYEECKRKEIDDGK